YFIGAGLTGICLYYLLENIALTFTMASNVGVILAVAPFFTGLAVYFFMREGERLTVGLFVGFAVALVGIAFISFNGTKLQLNPIGDMLAIFAAMVWAVYSLCTRKIANLGYATLPATKRIFGYGIIFMIPAMGIFHFNMDFSKLADPTNIFCLAFLGLGASAICFVSWNYALKLIGIVASSVYIYIGPVITVVAAAVILHEPITMMMAVGTVLTLAGMVISEFVKIKEL
ncbi:MAG: DMT family transporter, partial [Eubacterium sp.]|nr:DMT family transporter [Candidatus Colimonas fimequi]